MDWAKSLERDGYAVVPDVIGLEVVEDLAEAIDAIRPGSTALDRDGRVYAMRDLLREVPATRALANSEPVLGLARRVLGPKAFVVRGLLFDKTSETNWLVPWHQDLTIAVERRTEATGYGPWTVKGGIPHVRPPIDVLERMVTLRVQLDDSDLALGPLRVIPGSHSGGRLGAEATRDWLDRVPPEFCLVPKGGVLVMRPLILHASSPADASGRRRVIHLEYAADPLPGDVHWFESGASRVP